MNPLTNQLMASMAGRPMGTIHPQLGQGRMIQAMMGRARPGDARYARLGALPPYALSPSAETKGAGGVPPQGAFQPDAFQNDAFQVS